MALRKFLILSGAKRRRRTLGRIPACARLPCRRLGHRLSLSRKGCILARLRGATGSEMTDTATMAPQGSRESDVDAANRHLRGTVESLRGALEAARQQQQAA